LRRAVAGLAWSVRASDAPWAYLGDLTLQYGRSDIAAALIYRAEDAGWPIDGRAFAAFARLCSKFSLTEELLRVARACRDAKWPLDADAWNAFLLAVQSHPIAEIREDVLQGCDDNGWNISAAGWATWVRITELRGGNRTNRAVMALKSQLPLLPSSVISSILITLSAEGVIKRPLQRERAKQIVHVIWETRPSSDWLYHRGDFLRVMRLARRWHDRELIIAILQKVEARRFRKADINNTIAFLLTAYSVLGSTPEAAVQVAGVLSSIYKAFATDRTASIRIALLLRALAAVNGSTFRYDDLFSLVKVDLGFDISSSDFQLVAAAVDRGSLQTLLTYFEVTSGSLPDLRKRELYQKLIALFKVVGDMPSDSFALIKIGQMHRRERYYSMALNLFNQAERAADDNASRSVANYEIGLTLLDEGKADKALPYLQRSAELSDVPRASTLTKAAEAAKRIGNYKLATGYLEALLAVSDEDVRALLQLAATIVDGVRTQALPTLDLWRVKKITARIFELGTDADDRELREAAAIAIETLGLHSKDPGSIGLSEPILQQLANSDSLSVLNAICSAIVEQGVWPDVVVDALLTRIINNSGESSLFRLFVRCLSAGMATAYHRGSLGNKTYLQAIARIFRRLLRSPVNNRETLLFELFVARREQTLQLVLSKYAAMAEHIVAVFLRPAPDAQSRPELRGALVQINQLLAEEMPTGLRPAGYGSTDIIPFAPLIASFVARLNVRAAMSAARGEVAFREVRGELAVRGAHLEWMRIRTAIASIVPLANESPFTSIAQVSVPWFVTIICEFGKIIVEVRFPAGIHPQHEPAQLLESALQKVYEWHRGVQVIGLACAVDVTRWIAERVLSLRFDITPPQAASEIEAKLEPFTLFLAAETRRILRGGAPSSLFFADARRLFDRCDDAVLTKGDGWLAHYHRHLMDVHFSTTAEWLFIGESLAEAKEKPEYHPRYEVHSLKTSVAAALADMERTNTIAVETMDDLRRRLVAMRRNILSALRKISNGTASELGLINIMAVIRNVISTIPYYDNNSVIAIVGPFYLLARADSLSLHAALSNLLLNAVEADAESSTEGEITITVGMEDTEWLSIAVSNRFDSGAKKAHGFGLGLADTRFHIEVVNRGSLEHGPTNDGLYVVTIRLRRWGDGS
jgi:tetratricopeptide (TPR) repeat protein